MPLPTDEGAAGQEAQPKWDVGRFGSLAPVLESEIDQRLRRREQLKNLQKTQKRRVHKARKTSPLNEGLGAGIAAPATHAAGTAELLRRKTLGGAREAPSLSVPLTSGLPQVDEASSTGRTTEPLAAAQPSAQLKSLRGVIKEDWIPVQKIVYDSDYETESEHMTTPVTPAPTD